MPRAGLTRAAVGEVALALVDDGGVAGFDRLTLAAVAGRAGVAVPSLYKHVASLDDLRRLVAVAAVEELTRRLAAATIGRSGEEAVREAARTVRVFAHEHPGRYAATQVAPDLADPADADLAARADETIRVLAAALRGFGLPDDAGIDAIRILRSTLHGFVSLELGGGFGLPDDLDRTFTRLVDGLVAGLAALAGPEGPAGSAASAGPAPLEEPAAPAGSAALVEPAGSAGLEGSAPLDGPAPLEEPAEPAPPAALEEPAAREEPAEPSRQGGKA